MKTPNKGKTPNAAGGKSELVDKTSRNHMRDNDRKSESMPKTIHKKKV